MITTPLTRNLPNPDYCIVFICQYGELEVRSLLLAASLRKYLIGNYELVAAVPTPEEIWGKLESSTLQLMKQLDVRLQPIKNPISPNYPMLNKLAALAVKTKAPTTIYLDADILCIQQLEVSQAFKSKLAMKPADYQTYSMDKHVWEKIYGTLDLDLPERRVLSTVDNKLMFPYFNSGVVCSADAKALSQAWIKACQAILADNSIVDKDYWICQLALPVASKQLNIPFTCLSEDYNFPSNCQTLNVNNLPFLCHYKNNARLRAEPIMVQLVQEILEKHPQLKHLFNRHDDWKPFLTRKKIINPSKQQDFIITGIPRSGTSLLCNLLDKQKNCVVINEPRQIFDSLAAQSIPWGVALYHGDVRRDIAENKLIENKVINGNIIEDTYENDKRSYYQPEVSEQHFLLGTKNTISYLSRIPNLKMAMPNSRIITCVRHPFDTIASWKSTFEMLNKASVDDFPIGNPNDKFMSHEQRQRLQTITQCSDLMLRRALLWNHFANLIIENIEYLLIIQYENIINLTEPTLTHIMNKISCGAFDTKINIARPLNPRSKQNLLSDMDKQIIQDICSPTAKKLGYIL